MSCGDHVVVLKCSNKDTNRLNSWRSTRDGIVVHKSFTDDMSNVHETWVFGFVETCVWRCSGDERHIYKYKKTLKIVMWTDVIYHFKILFKKINRGYRQSRPMAHASIVGIQVAGERLVGWTRHVVRCHARALKRCGICVWRVEHVLFGHGREHRDVVRWCGLCGERSGWELWGVCGESLVFALVATPQQQTDHKDEEDVVDGCVEHV